ncbi:MAG TPA: alkaline shock response membrane anchor protein AmaP [Pseudonocardiaceae bacterium]|jgi:hypothetical protein|nr:alkaline shock response membrane anchor protein AmaP [Pseudonocardiaceae bacterium]
MSTQSRAALARSARGDRLFVGLVGLLALLAGAAALVVGQGWLGQFRAGRALLDPIAVSWLAGHADLARGLAIGIGVLLLIFGLWRFGRALRTERRPDLLLDTAEGAGLTVTGGALAAAVAEDSQTIDGVSRARVRPVGRSGRPALRITLWLTEGADIRAVWEELSTGVLSRARESLGVDELPTAVRLELDAAQAQRVR